MNKNSCFTLFMVFFSLISVTVSAQKTNTVIPENLHGFWQFQVPNKGDWNGILIGGNFAERSYNLAEAESVRQDGNRYDIALTYSDRWPGNLHIELISDEEADIRFDDGKPMRCRRFTADPDIELLPVSQYGKAVGGAWISGNDTRKPLEINGNKLSLNGETWHIHRLGEYLKREFRALVENNGEYRLIYITHLPENQMKLVFNSSTLYFRPMPPEISRNLLYGTWCNPQTNDWIIGFFDDVAVYQNQKWRYRITETKKRNYTVELQSDNEIRRVSFRLKNNNGAVAELRDGNTRQTLAYTPKPQPYRYADTRPFADSGYKPDSVTISGYLQKVPNPQKPFNVVIVDLAKNEQKQYFADIDAYGCFTITFPVLNTSEIFLDWGRMFLTDVVEPGEKYFVYADYAGTRDLMNKSDAQVWFMGSNARFHSEISAYFFREKIAPYPYYDDFGGSPDAYLAICKDIYRQKTDHIDRFFSENPIPSERLKTYLQKKEMVDFGSSLMQARFGLKRTEKERFSQVYMSVADSIFRQLPEPVTLSREVVRFLIDYTDYYLELMNDEGNTGIVVPDMIALDYFDKNGIFPLTDEQRNTIKAAKEGMEMNILLQVQGKDSLYVAEKMASYEASFDSYWKIVSDSAYKHLYETEWKKVEDAVMFNRKFAAVDSLEMPQHTRELLTLSQAFSIFEHRRKPIADVELKIFDRRIKNPAFNALLQNEQEKYVTLQGQSIAYIESLKRTDHLKEAKDADELLKKLTEPYLGKVIYIDFWGVWCAPCKIQMEHIGKTKEALKGKDVVFMYFANRSPEDSWKNVIKQYDLTGENVVHYNLPKEQQDMLERRLGINSFPTYMIMDKSGTIVDMNPARPMQSGRLTEQLNGWIEK